MAGANRPLVLVPQPIHPDGLATLAAVAEVMQGGARQGDPPEQAYAALPECDAVLVRTIPLPGSLIQAAPRLKVIARHGVGVDNVDIPAATARGIPVTATPEANHRSVAEFVVGAMIALARSLPAADRAVRSGDFEARNRLFGLELHGKVLAIVGLGRVGRSLAQICGQGLGMRVRAFDPFVTADVAAALGVELAPSLDEALAGADVVSVHVPLTPQTRQLIGARELALLPRHAIVIQASRGGVVDEGALAAVLASGRLRGAAVDVFSQEPPPPDHPLLGLPNVILSPHMASHTEEAMRRMAVDAASEIVRVLRGERPRWAVNARELGW